MFSAFVTAVTTATFFAPASKTRWMLSRFMPPMTVKGTFRLGPMLAMASGLGEEVFFRGALQNALFGGWTGVLLQAIAFAALHPVPDRKAWAYPLFVFCAGWMFGAAYLLTGSLIPGILAHYIQNARGFYQLLEQGEEGNKA